MNGESANPTQSGLRGGLTWEQLADGSVHRLKRGKHFVGNCRLLAREAAEAADRMDRPIHVMRDEFGKWQYIWVQFADIELPVGSACVCGSRELLRVHETFGRCPRCARSVLFKGTRLPRGKGKRAPERDLHAYTDVQVRFVAAYPRWERFAGRAVNQDGVEVLILVDYQLGVDGERIQDPDRPGQPLVRIRALTLDPFRDVLDLEALTGEKDDAG